MAQADQNWLKLDYRYYRRAEVYQMAWGDIELERYIHAVGAFAGPIALTRDPNVMMAARAGVSRPMIEIYSPSGFKLSTINWDKGRIVGLGWTDEEDLVVVVEDASVYMYDIRGTFVKTFTMGQEPRDEGVQEMQMCRGGTGLVVRTHKDRFFSVGSFVDPKPRRLASVPDEYDEAGGEGAPRPSGPVITSWTILSHGPTIEVLVAANRDLYVIDPNEAWDAALPESQMAAFVAMAVSANGRVIALVSETGRIGVISSDFQENISSFDTGSKVPPRQFLWCGSDCICAYWDQMGASTGTLLLVGPKSKYLSYSYDQRIILHSAIDGLRIIGEDKHEFLQAVPEPVVNVFDIGSMHPGAMLHDARQAFDNKDPAADDLIRDIKENRENPDALAVAVSQCIQAAGEEFEPRRQRSLLRAARFGMDFLEGSPNEFVDMCQSLRVLWHVRDFKISIPLTYRQYKELGIRVLVDRLIARGLYWLAYEICKYLKLEGQAETRRVLVQWACSQVKRSDADDDAVADIIIDKLKSTEGISFAEIARAATMQRRTELAVRLLDEEPRYAEQVPLLLVMREEDLALKKAIASGDSDLVHLVVMHLQTHAQTIGAFLRVIDAQPVARNLFLQFCRENNPDMLKDFYYEHDKHYESGNLQIEEAYACSSIDQHVGALQRAVKSYQHARDKEFMVKATEEQVRLLEVQRQLEKAFKRPFVGLPLGDVIFEVLVEGELDKANRLKKEFKVPDRRFWWIKVKALAESRNFLELEKFAKSKKSPIGYKPFVEECLAKNNRFEAKKHIERLAPAERVPYYIECMAWEEAVQSAVAARSDELLDMIGAKCQGRRDVLKLIHDAREGGGK